MTSYGFSFGIELTADNVLAYYFNDHFGLDIIKAGDVASVFGLLNIVSRPLGELSPLPFAQGNLKTVQNL